MSCCGVAVSRVTQRDMRGVRDNGSVPDSNALKQRRKRAHAKGDHHLCRATCAARRIAAVPDDSQGGAPESSGITDPAEGLRTLAARLEEAHRQCPGDVSLARVLKDTWLAVLSAEGGRNGGLEALLNDLSAS